MTTFAFAQVAIGKSTVSNSSVSLEFGDYTTGQGKGITLPYINGTSTVTDVVPGTLIFDTSDKIVKFKINGTAWVNLTKNETVNLNGNANFNTTGQVDTSLQDSFNENTSAKTSIGTTTNTKGILVLEDANKAMILPKVPNPHLNIINPEPGTLVYDTANNQLAVYNGTVWSFWKP